MKKLILLLFIWGQTLSQIEVVGNQITVEKLKTHITILASDSLEGREVGQPGEIMAAEYMSNYFNQLGIPPYKDSTYYQEIPLEKRLIESVNIKVDGVQYEFKEDFYTYPNFSQTRIRSKDIVFLGYGIDTETYSDYNTNVEGRVIMIFNGEPIDNDGNYLVSGGKEKSPESNWKMKLNVAKQNGAKAVLFITENYKSNYKRVEHKINHPGVSLSKKEEPIPFFYISKKMANDILGKNNRKCYLGGGQTKVLNFIDNMHIIKDNLFKTPDLFQLIAKESQVDFSEMYSVFNMGHRMEFYTDKNTANEIIQIAKSFNIDAQIIGKCVSSSEKKLTIKSQHGEFIY